MLKKKHFYRIVIAVEFMFTDIMESSTQSGFQLFPVTCFVSTSYFATHSIFSFYDHTLYIISI